MVSQHGKVHFERHAITHARTQETQLNDKRDDFDFDIEMSRSLMALPLGVPLIVSIYMHLIFFALLEQTAGVGTNS